VAWTSLVANTRRRGSSGEGSEARSAANWSSSGSGGADGISAGKDEVWQRQEIATKAALRELGICRMGR
jgi:hypothetical protein